MTVRGVTIRSALLKSMTLLLLILLASTSTAVANDFQKQLDQAGIPYVVRPSGKAILVNIPAFELIAFDDGRPVLRSKVIVGAPGHRTPRVHTHVSTVRFRPTWRPTPSMIASGEYSDRIRPPGENNPLGLAAVRLEPGMLTYLHDTNKRHLFANKYRAMSHGCVRVERWDALVSFVLEMDIVRVHQLAHGRQTVDIPASPIPVELGYYTRFPDARGQIVSHSDVYGLLDQSNGSDQDTEDPGYACENGDIAD